MFALAFAPRDFRLAMKLREKTKPLLSLLDTNEHNRGKSLHVLFPALTAAFTAFVLVFLRHLVIFPIRESHANSFSICSLQCRGYHVHQTSESVSCLQQTTITALKWSDLFFIAFAIKRQYIRI